jgi:hypothetical protein
MPDQPPPKLPAIGWAGFEKSPAAAGHGRRKSRWAINPLRDGARASAESARFSSLEAELLQGLGRRKEE